MSNRFSATKSFSALSLKDLLDARELFHPHLLNKKNVVGTAIGRYLFRHDDPEPGKPKPDRPRLLAECEVREYSWPCVLVFLKEWQPRNAFSGSDNRLQYEDYVPQAIYLPDGRTVPICKVHAPPLPPREVEISETDMVFPSTVIGGGYPVVIQVQNESHVASVGCLVSDGHKTYALTNRHATGATGEVLYTRLNGRLVPIGKTSALSLGKKPFEEIYPGWPGKDVLVNLDIGLIDVDDLHKWTSQIYGIGKLGRTADVNVHNLSLNLIGCQVRAYGCASRQMFGQIAALFYRYKSLGGIEYTTDFLIGPRPDKEFNTAVGDSGTVWVAEKSETAEHDLEPIAVQWGGHVFSGDGGQRSPFALASCLSTVCRELDVDVVGDWHNEYPAYWGAVGHYAMAAKASFAVRNPRLRQLIEANLTRITFDPDHISGVEMKGISKRPFIPLADIPDMKFRFSRPSGEPPNHFADIDNPELPNLMTLCEDPANVNVEVWRKYYDGIGKTSARERGLLPFRVWQIFEAMERYAAEGKVAEFVCAAGILAHYPTDACQPLHASYLAKGDPEDPTNVHSGYEKDMIELKSVPATIMAELEQRLSEDRDGRPAIKSGHDAAVRTVELMRETLRLLPPEEITSKYKEWSQDHPKREVSKLMWEAFGERTIEVMALGCRTLADLWEAAWQNARVDEGNRIADSELVAVNEDRLTEIYDDLDFLPSRTLDKIGPLLTAQAAPPQQPSTPQKRKPAHAKAKAA